MRSVLRKSLPLLALSALPLALARGSQPSVLRGWSKRSGLGSPLRLQDANSTTDQSEPTESDPSASDPDTSTSSDALDFTTNTAFIFLNFEDGFLQLLNETLSGGDAPENSTDSGGSSPDDAGTSSDNSTSSDPSVGDSSDGQETAPYQGGSSWNVTAWNETSSGGSSFSRRNNWNTTSPDDGSQGDDGGSGDSTTPTDPSTDNSTTPDSGDFDPSSLGLPQTLVDFLTSAHTLLESIRGANVGPIIFTRLQFDSEYSALPEDNVPLAYIRQNQLAVEGTDWTNFIAGFEPGDGEPTVETIRGDATYGSELLTTLDAQDVQKVVLCGTSTSGSVLATLRTLADNNYQVYVGLDCIIDGSETDWLTYTYFPTQGFVVGNAAIVQGLGQSNSTDDSTGGDDAGGDDTGGDDAGGDDTGSDDAGGDDAGVDDGGSDGGADDGGDGGDDNGGGDNGGDDNGGGEDSTASDWFPSTTSDDWPTATSDFGTTSDTVNPTDASTVNSGLSSADGGSTTRRSPSRSLASHSTRYSPPAKTAAAVSASSSGSVVQMNLSGPEAPALSGSPASASASASSSASLDLGDFIGGLKRRGRARFNL